MLEKPEVRSREYCYCVVCLDKGIHHWYPEDETCRHCGRKGCLVKTARPEAPKLEELSSVLTRIRSRALMQRARAVQVRNDEPAAQVERFLEESDESIMAKKATAKKAVKATTKAAKPAKREKVGGTSESGRLQFTSGKTLGLGITETWVQVFTNNDAAKKSAKLDDAAIAKFMLKEFPEQDSKPFRLMREGKLYAVQGQRARFNRWEMTKGEDPGFVSHRYDADGEVDDTPFSGKAGVKVTDLAKQGFGIKAAHLDNAKPKADKKPAKAAAKKADKKPAKKVVKVKKPVSSATE